MFLYFTGNMDWDVRRHHYADYSLVVGNISDKLGKRGISIVLYLVKENLDRIEKATFFITGKFWVFQVEKAQNRLVTWNDINEPLLKE